MNTYGRCSGKRKEFVCEDAHERNKMLGAVLGRLVFPLTKTVNLHHLRLASPVLNNKGLSNAYALLLGLVGLAMTGFVWAIMDQIILGDLWNFNIQQQLSGTMLQIYRMMWLFIPVIIGFTFIIGMVVNAHKTRTSGE